MSIDLQTNILLIIDKSYSTESKLDFKKMTDIFHSMCHATTDYDNRLADTQTYIIIYHISRQITENKHNLFKFIFHLKLEIEVNLALTIQVIQLLKIYIWKRKYNA